MRRRRFLTTSAALATPLVAGCASGGSGGTSAPVEVALVNFAFEPGSDSPIAVDAGTTVRFVWETSSHNIHVDSQPAGASWAGHEQIESAGFEHEHTFEVPGEYHYFCIPHERGGMLGVVVADG